MSPRFPKTLYAEFRRKCRRENVYIGKVLVALARLYTEGKLPVAERYVAAVAAVDLTRGGSGWNQKEDPK